MERAVARALRERDRAVEVAKAEAQKSKDMETSVAWASQRIAELTKRNAQLLELLEPQAQVDVKVKRKPTKRQCFFADCPHGGEQAIAPYAVTCDACRDRMKTKKAKARKRRQ